MRVGIAHHLGWAVVVTADDDYSVIDRRRIELVEPGLPHAPIHHGGGTWPLHSSGPSPSDAELTALVAKVRASAVIFATTALDDLGASTSKSIVSISLCAWPAGFPTDIATLRRVPYEAKADSVMYRQVLAEVGEARGLGIAFYDAKTVEAEATAILGKRADDVLNGPRKRLGPPWTKDHRTALAATIVA